MTQPPVEPLTLVPPGYAGAWLMDNDRKAAEKSTRAGLMQWVEEFWPKIETMMAAMGVKRQSDPTKRLIAYLLKPQELWDEYAQKFPERFEKAWDAYQDLRERAERGEFQRAA